MYAFEGRLLFSRDTLLVFIFFCACLLPELHIWKPYQREIPMQRLTLSILAKWILHALFLANDLASRLCVALAERSTVLPLLRQWHHSVCGKSSLRQQVHPKQ